MSKGFRVLLQILQVICLLGALVLLASSVLVHIADIDLLSLDEGVPVEQWAVGFGVLAVGFSPALWSLSRAGGQAAVRQSTGSFDRVAPAPGVPQQPSQPSQPGNVFEPMSAAQAPAPPASSYGQPSAPGITPTSSPQAGSPWGSGR
ncbi:hypothetical protein [Glycomyces harbinensis]|uniref:Uncharacterized protein n=1 Tax=Glycomyces harbinensis TaxID=58114 RepID=A0A1G6SUB6_9ACTN|nr:hypothetical protein [Glycomyces harbinensis]SDD20368.1 hypothetical protein SAMN05216270_102296 [Glycomyces harbinensis]